MPKCIQITGDTIIDTGQSIADCTEFVVMTGSDYRLYTNDSFYTLLQSLFMFDLEICTQVVSAGLLMFLVSHYAGNLVRWLGK